MKLCLFVIFVYVLMLLMVGWMDSRNRNKPKSTFKKWDRALTEEEIRDVYNGKEVK